VEAVSEIAMKNRWNIVETEGGEMMRMLQLKRVIKIEGKLIILLIYFWSIHRRAKEMDKRRK
jgi:hypothetical protein